MGKGHYLGGSTIIRPGSDWFGYTKPKRQKRKPKPKKKSGIVHMSRQARAFEEDEKRKAKVAAKSDARKAARANSPPPKQPCSPRPQKTFVVERKRPPRRRPT